MINIPYYPSHNHQIHKISNPKNRLIRLLTNKPLILKPTKTNSPFLFLLQYQIHQIPANTHTRSNEPPIDNLLGTHFEDKLFSVISL